MAHLTREGDIWLLNLGSGENRFHPDWVARLNDLLDEVERGEGPRALVTCADGKFWSTGLDLDWLMAHRDETEAFLRAAQTLLARILILPLATVAAVQGHAFAAGAMLACAHDQTVMRADRGYWCLPEVDLGLPFTPGMQALLRARLPVRTAHHAMTTGRRYSGTDAAAAGIADTAVEESRVVAAALELAVPLAPKAGPALGRIKAQMHAEVAAALRDGPVGVP